MNAPASPSAAPDTRRRILDLAEELLLSRGFNAFSYQHIAQALGVKPAAIHYHYATKEALGTNLVARQRGRLRKWRELPQVQQQSPAGQLEALLRVYETHLGADRRLCLFGALAAEFNTLPATMQAELRLFNTELTGWLAQVLSAGRKAGQLRFTGHSSTKAAQVLTTIAGALQVARVHDAGLFHLIIGQLRAELLPEEAA